MRIFSLLFVVVLLLSACNNSSPLSENGQSQAEGSGVGQSQTATADSIDAGPGVDTSAYDPATGKPFSIKPSIDLDVSGLLPEGYVLLDSASGDLNLDPYRDLLLVLKKPDEQQTSDVVGHPEKRPLLILLGQPDGSFITAARSDNAVYCVDCGGVMGDPYTGLVIKDGYFSIEHYGGSNWRWTRVVTFKYSGSDKKWYLHKDGGDYFHSSDPEKVETKVKTAKDFGKIEFKEFDIYRD